MTEDFGTGGGRVGEEVAEFRQFAGIVAPWNPQFQVTVCPVFVVEVLYCPFDLSGNVELGIIVKSVLQRPPDDGFGVDESVGFSHYFPVNAAWLVSV